MVDVLENSFSDHGDSEVNVSWSRLFQNIFDHFKAQVDVLLLDNFVVYQIWAVIHYN